METELLVKIRSALEGSGIDVADEKIEQFVTSTKKANAVTKEVGSTGKEASKNLREVGESARGTQEVIEGLTRVQAGGVDGFLGLVKGMRGFISVSKGLAAGALPFGTILTVIAAVGAAIFSLKNSFSSAGTEMKSSETKAKELATALSLIKADTAAAVALQIAKITENADNAIKRLGDVKEALLHLSDNKLATDQVKIKNNETLTPAQKEIADFQAQNTARKNNFQVTKNANAAEIADREKETSKSIVALQAAVDEEKQIREERNSLIQESPEAREALTRARDKNTQQFKREAGGGLVPVGPAPTKATQKAQDEAENRFERISKRLALIDGEPGKTDGLLSIASATTIEKSKAALQVTTKNIGDPATGKGGAIADFRRTQDLAESDFATKQFAANSEFVAKQKEESKKLSDENTNLEKEKHSLADKDLRAGFGGDATAKTRIEEINKRQDAIKLEGAQRTAIIPKVQDATTSLIKKYGQQLSDAISEAKPDETVSTDHSAIPSHGVRPGPGIIRDSKGAIFNNELTAPGHGKITRTGQEDTSSTASDSSSPLTTILIANTAALNANTAALKAASPAGNQNNDAAVKGIDRARSDTGKALDKLHGATVSAISAVAGKADNQAREMDQIQRVLRAKADRS